MKIENSCPRRGETLALFLAALLFAVVLRWPLMFLDRDSPTEAGLFKPPAWLLPLDDAYIFVRYAQQAARGRPFQWSDDEPSTGSTSFVFPVLQLPGQWLFDDLAGWSWWASFLGLLSLWALGVAGLRLLRAAGVPDPWPLAAGLALIWSGPIAWVSIAGMDSALGCAALLWATGSWILACRPGNSPGGIRDHLGLLVIVGLLPLFRPDFAVVAGLVALALVARLGPAVPRWSAAVVLLPGLLLGVLNWTLTGYFSPGGVIAKSNLSLSLPVLADIYGLLFWRGLVPAYAGLEGRLLPPPIGWLAAAMAVAVVAGGVSRWLDAGSRWRGLFPLAILWLALVAVAPLSGYLTWQHLRHHHPGLACAWLLAVAALAELTRIARRRGLFESWRHGLRRYGRPLILALPCLLWINFHSWSFDFFVESVRFYQNNGRVAEWLAENHRDQLLLLHDAGLLAIAHDGPATDVIGLGTTELARSYRGGAGATVEALARRPRLPTIAAVWPDAFPIPELLGPPLFKVPARPDLPENLSLRVAPLLQDRLASTALSGPGIDLAYLPDERRLGRQNPSKALTLLGADGQPRTHGCRPLSEVLHVELPEGLDHVRIRAAGPSGLEGRLRVDIEDHEGRVDDERVIVLPGDSRSWTEGEVRVGGVSAGAWLTIENAGPGVPCLESIAFQPR